VQAISNNRGVRIGIPSKGHVGSEEAGGDNGESHIYESSCWPSERAAMHGNSIEYLSMVILSSYHTGLPQA
jgi:hypothetical protein